MSNTKDEAEEISAPQRPPSPPSHTTFAARGVVCPVFSAFRPRDVRISSPHAMNHIAWSCDGNRVAAVGIDKVVRAWYPEKSMELRSASAFTGGHSEDVDYVAWNPTHPDLFCSSSQKDRRIVFWDARQSRHLQQISLKSPPFQLSYSPDGKTLLYTTTNKQVSYFSYGKEGDQTKEQWNPSGRNPTIASTATFNHAGDGLVLTHSQEHSIRLCTFPGMNMILSTPAHVGGCMAAALDPRGRYLATGGNDSIVNLFDTTDWICARTITACDHSINAISFSYDGEYLAIASSGSYIDISATETGLPVHRIPTLGPSPTVSWHPSRYTIAYCGQTKIREGGPPPSAWLTIFGVGG